jgi:hypothetical protein
VCSDFLYKFCVKRFFVMRRTETGNTINVHVKYPLFLSDVKKTTNIKISGKSLQWNQSYSIRNDGRTGVICCVNLLQPTKRTVLYIHSITVQTLL